MIFFLLFSGVFSLRVGTMKFVYVKFSKIIAREWFAFWLKLFHYKFDHSDPSPGVLERFLVDFAFNFVLCSPNEAFFFCSRRSSVSFISVKKTGGRIHWESPLLIFKLTVSFHGTNLFSKQNLNAPLILDVANGVFVLLRSFSWPVCRLELL